MKKYFCSVYNEPEKRFNSTNNADGCWESTRLNLKKDYFPGSPNIMFWINGVLETMFWAPKKCNDGTMRPLGIKECTFIWNNKIEEYEGECTQCGQCCGLYENKPCKYLRAYENTT
jgi:hypothetical protein